MLGIPWNMTNVVAASLLRQGVNARNGRWEIFDGIPRPRGLTGCAFLTSWEVTMVLGVDVCTNDNRRSLRMYCSASCGCHPSMDECPNCRSSMHSFDQK